MMDEMLTQLPFGFPGQVYRSPMPFGPFDPDDEVLELYQGVGIDVVVMLVSIEEAWEKTGIDLLCLYRENGMQLIYLPIPDFDVPEAGTLLQGLAQAHLEIKAGRNLAVHCNAGVGRTGLFMACLARKVFGMPGAQAIRWVRQYIEHAVENESQVSFVQDLELPQGG
jgi:protein-tyrosine phosphatase